MPAARSTLNDFGRDDAVVLAVCQQKGGEGEAFLTLALVDDFTQRGYRVLALDLDPQANLTEALQPDKHPELTINDVLYGDRALGGEVVSGSLVDAISDTGPQWRSLRYVPAELALAARLRRRPDRLPTVAWAAHHRLTNRAGPFFG